MATIKKKVWPRYFEKVSSGEKKYELRLNDFDIGPGDILLLEEWDPETKQYTGRSVEKKVSSVDKFEKLFWTAEEIGEKGLQIISIE